MGFLVSKGSTAEVTFTSPQQIIISHLDDSIRIGDGTDLAEVTAAGALVVDGSAVTQPVSAASLPLPTGAATAAGQLPDNHQVTVSNFPATQDVNVVSSVEVEVKNDSGSPIPVSGTVAATQSGTWNINDISGTVSLPTGAATAARQDTGNASLSSIDAGIPAGLGATTASASMPVTLSTDGYPYVQLPDGGSTAIPTASVLTQSFSGVGFGTYINTNGASTLSIHGVGVWNALIAIYGSNDGGTTNQNLPLYAFTNGSQQTFLQTDNSGQTCNIGGWKQVVIRCVTYTSGAPIAIKYWLNDGTGPQFVMSQLASALKTESWTRDGAGTSITVGQKAMTASFPIVIASDQSAISAAQSGTWNINNVSGTVSLPTGASTLTEQQTQTASLSVMDDWDESDRAKVNLIVGQAGVQGGAGAVSATTQRVVIATDQTSYPVTISTAVTEAYDYNTSAALAAAGTNNHDYTTPSAFELMKVVASAMSSLKITVQTETAASSGSFTTRFVGFTSASNPTLDIQISPPITVASGAKVRIIRQNNDNQAQDVYSTIGGTL